MKIFTALTLAVIFALSCFAGEADTRLQFKTNGFSIAPLECVSDTTPYQPVMMFLPATEAFAPNVNVQIQPYDGTLKDFVALSQQQFKAGGFTVLKEKMTEATVAWEYSGMLQGRKLHWYARALQKKNKIYLVTATATESQWVTVSAKLKNCVDSFRIEDGEQRPERDK
jgi:hypothetical protein